MLIFVRAIENKFDGIYGRVAGVVKLFCELFIGVAHLSFHFNFLRTNDRRGHFCSHLKIMDVGCAVDVRPVLYCYMLHAAGFNERVVLLFSKQMPVIRHASAQKSVSIVDIRRGRRGRHPRSM